MSGFNAVGVLIAMLVAGLACDGSTASKATIEVGSDMNVSGADGAYGLPVQYGVAFAFARAKSVRGFSLKLVPLDDAVYGKYDPYTGGENVRRFVADPRLLGMIGPLRSPVTWVALPIANRASLAMISPTNSDECLTLTLDYCQAYTHHTAASLRPTGKNTYFRIAAAETFLGPAMADFAYSLGLRTIAVWDDQETFGLVMADRFADEFTRKGGAVVARQGFDTRTNSVPDFHAWLKEAKGAGAQAIFAGATSATYGCVPRQQSQGIIESSSYYLGSGGGTDLRDGIADQQCISDAGPMANAHMYASQGIGDAGLNPGAAAVMAAYERAHPDPADTNAFTFAGYDAAAILIDAIGRAIDADGGKIPTRQQVVDQLAQTTNYQGLTGTYTFSANGDPTTPTLQILQDKGGTWTPIKNIVVTEP